MTKPKLIKLYQGIDHTGQRFGNLVVTRLCKEADPENSQKYGFWWCMCDCGTEIKVHGNILRQGKKVGCSKCQPNSRIKHGMSNSSEYGIWSAMIERCTKDKEKNKRYFGRGITVCPEWLNSFDAFIADMGLRPGKGYSIDRIENNKGYTKENCRWATAKVQQNNMSSNRQLTANGKTQNIVQWAAEVNLSKYVISSRLNQLGWSVEDALFTPLQQGVPLRKHP